MIDMALLHEVVAHRGSFGVEDPSSDASFVAFETKTRALEEQEEEGVVKILRTAPNGMNGHSRYYKLHAELTRRGRELVERDQ